MNQFNNVQEEQENEDEGSDGNPNRRKQNGVQSPSNQHNTEGVTSQHTGMHDGFDTNNIPQSKTIVDKLSDDEAHAQQLTTQQVQT